MGFPCSIGHPLFEQRYRTIDARDARFDGQFFTAVSSTGIYCRPSCPARTPKPANVTFFLTSAAAHEAGFRACKRCLPEAVPGTPEWNLRSNLAARAMRLITDGVVDREGVEGLATRLGYTQRHIHRVLAAELGAGPLALARARRAQSARALLVDSTLPLGQVAFAAGFNSIRQFNDTIAEVYSFSPGELRARSKAGAFGAVSGGQGFAVRLSIGLPVRQPFDAPGVFRFLGARAVDGVEVADVSDPGRLRYARTLSLPAGPGAIEVTATGSGNGWEVRVHLELSALGDVAPAVARVRRLLDLDADPIAIDNALRSHAELAGLVAQTPGMRVPGAADAHELVIRALTGQQISVAAARTHLSRLTERAGAPYASGISGLTRLFPTPARIRAAVPAPVAGEAVDPARPLRLPGRAVRAVLAICEALETGTLAVDVGADAGELRSRLLAQPGIGPWTASYIAMRVLGDPDAWLEGDVALLAGARTQEILPPGLSKTDSHRFLSNRSRSWAPWRSYAATHLWQAASAAGVPDQQHATATLAAVAAHGEPATA